MNSKNIRTILIIFIIINIIAFFTIIRVINKEETKEDTEQVIDEDVMSNGELRDGFKNVETLYKNYRGYIPKSEIAYRIEKMGLQYFPILKKQMKNNNMSPEEYFEKNKVVIKNRFGITKKEKFIKLVKKLNEITCNIDDCESYQIEEDSFTNDGIYTKCTLVYTYSNKQEMKLDFYINNSNSNSEIEYKIDP